MTQKALDALHLHSLTMPKKKQDAVSGNADFLSLSPATDMEDARRAITGKMAGKKAAPAHAKPGSSSVIYLGHLPHGFFEAELKTFFGQFGVVRKLKVSRSVKTGNSKGYAFLQFDTADVATIVAETMNNYILLGNRLVCHLVPKEKCHDRMFEGFDRTFNQVKWHVRHRYEKEKGRTAEDQDKREKRLVSADGKKRKQLAALGIEYDFDGYAGGAEAAPVAAKSAKKGKKGARKATDAATPAAKKAKKAATPAAAKVKKAATPAAKKVKKAATPAAKKVAASAKKSTAKKAKKKPSA